MPRLSKIGAAALAAFGWTSGSAVTASYLQVAGGGGGGFIAGGNRGAGGGAGGFLTGTVSLNPTLSYTVTVGAGGTPLANGSNSQFGALTASVGGGAGGSQNGASSVVGQNGGSGGGGPSQSGSGSTAGGTGTAGQGNDGAAGSNVSGQPYGCGGGGGAGAAGSLSNNPAGAGGVGLTSSITGTSTYYAGGGGGGTYAAGPGVGGAGGLGGGGTGGGSGGNSTSGTANLGGGGGGAEYSQTSGSNGGSGVVIISYVGAQQFGGGVVTSSSGNTIHTFNTSGTLSPLSLLTASYLVVAGGGGGAATAASGQSGGAGGGGAGGYLSGSSLTLDTNSIYAVTVGAGGLGATTSAASGSNGSNSSFSMVSTAAVGGGGGACNGSNNGSAGGSGGGGYGFPLNTYNGGAGTAGQGNNGGRGFTDGATYTTGGGGGGSGAAATQKTSNSGGDGGAGTANSISGTSVTYAGGGGGGGSGGAGGTGAGGGGNGGAIGNNGSAGTANLGGGGGGAGGGNTPVFNGGNGGSGVVIISYAGSTQLMAGGTVTVAGGNVIHTFTSSGYLTPIVLVTNSLRFRGSASAFLNRTFSTPTSRRIFTFSVWTKRGELVSNDFIFGRGTGPESYLQWSNDNTLEFYDYTGSSYSFRLVTTQVFRDPSAWYHIVVALDTTQATAANRIKIYVNGVQVTAFSTATYPSQNFDSNLNTNATVYIGRSEFASNYIDGYMDEINFIDGQALTPNSFGTFNGLGVWQPVRYGGSYGINGFYLPFTNTTSTTTLGYDFSPQGNNWTTNNISLTAGITYDSMTDVPTLTSATTANYAVMNPLANGGTLSGGNLNATSGTNIIIYSTFALQTNKYYWEVTLTNSTTQQIGIADFSKTNTTNVAPGDAGKNGYIYLTNGSIYNNGSQLSSGLSTVTTNDVVGIAYDSATNKLWFNKNGGTWFGGGDPASGTTPTVTTSTSFTYCPVLGAGGGSDAVNVAVNFGQRPFAYTPPTGYVRLNTFNLP